MCVHSDAKINKKQNILAFKVNGSVHIATIQTAFAEGAKCKKRKDEWCIQVE